MKFLVQIERVVSIFVILLLLMSYVLNIGVSIAASRDDLEKQDSATNLKQVDFDVYFKDSTHKYSKENNIKDGGSVFISIDVKDSVWITDGKIEFENPNFKISEKEDNKSQYVDKIEGNTIYLKNVSYGQEVEIEVSLSFEKATKIPNDYLNRSTNVNFSAQCKDSNDKTQDLKTQKQIQNIWTGNVDTSVNMDISKVLTLKTGTMIEMQLNTEVVEDVLPRKSENVNLQISNIEEKYPDTVYVLLNGKKLDESLVEYDNQKGTINIKNETVSDDNGIEWGTSKNEYKIVYKYNEQVNYDQKEFLVQGTVNTEIVSGQNVNKDLTNKYVLATKGNVVTLSYTSTESIYKGYMYANSNLNTEFDEELTLDVSNVEDISNIQVDYLSEGFANDQNQYSVNDSVIFLSTEINKENLFNILGESGKAEIYNQDYQLLTTITKDSSVDSNGNIVIPYDGTVRNIKMILSKPETAGKLVIKSKKAVKGVTGYTENQLKQFTKLVNNVQVTTIDVQTAQNEVQLLDAEYNVNAQISKSELSTIEKNEDVTIIGILETDSNKYHLYENPVVEFVFPNEVTEINVDSIKLLYEDEMTIEKADMVQNDEGKYILRVYLTGKQTQYKTDSITDGANIVINADITLDNRATSKEEKIGFNVYNLDKVLSKEILVNYKTPVELTSVDTVTGYNNQEQIKSVMGKGETGTLKVNVDQKTANVNNTIMNYNESQIQNVRILGKLPVSENKKVNQTEDLGNNVDLPLGSGISVNGRNDAKVYYSTNAEANNNLNDANNNWTEDINGAKSYLIVLENPMESKEKIDVNYNLTIPEGLEYDKQASSMYEVAYTLNEENKTYTTEPLTLTTGQGPNLDIVLAMPYSNQNVYNGQILDMQVTMTNDGDELLNNITLKANVPDGAKYIEFAGNNEGTDFTEKEEREIIWNIEKLEIGESVTKNYKLLVTDSTKDISLTANATVEGFDAVFDSNEIVKTAKEAPVTVRQSSNYNDDMQLYEGIVIYYRIEVTNTTDSQLNNFTLEDNVMDGLAYNNSYKVDEANLDLIEDGTYDEGARKVIWNIDSLAPGETKAFILYLEVTSGEEQLYNIAYANVNSELIPSNIITNSAVIPNISIEKSSSVDNKFIKEEQEFEYYIKVTNNGTNATQVTCTDEIPSGLYAEQLTYQIDQNTPEVQDITGNTAISVEEEIPAGGVLNITIKVKANSLLDDEEEKEVINVAKVEAKGMEAKESNQVDHVIEKKITINDLSIEKGVSAQTVMENDEFEYYIKITNNGTEDTILECIDEIPDGIFAKEVISQLDGEEEERRDVLYNSIISVNKTIPAGKTLNITLKVQANILANPEENIEVRNNAQITTNEGLTKTSNEVVTVIQRSPEIHPEEPDPEPEPDPDPENPDPENPDPENPDPENPDPENPDPENPDPENPDPENPDPENPDPENPDPENPDPENPDPENPGSGDSDEEAIYKVTGTAWLDENRDGIKDSNERRLENISVSLITANNNQFVTDLSGNIVTKYTDANGEYEFENLKPGKYIVVFQYNTSTYTVTKYKVTGISERTNSDAIEREISYNNSNITAGVTDEIEITDISISDIDIGLVEKDVFDLSLKKEIGQIKVTTGSGTVVYNGAGQNITKIELDSKKMAQTQVEVQYLITVKNEGRLEGYVKEIYDYLPEQLDFDTQANSSWKKNGNKIVNTSLENQIIKPGEEKTIELVLTKDMNNAELGTIINLAEVGLDYNEKGIKDIDSTAGNMQDNEDDMSSVTLIIGVKTGRTVLYISIITISILMLGFGVYMIKKKVLGKEV